MSRPTVMCLRAAMMSVGSIVLVGALSACSAAGSPTRSGHGSVSSSPSSRSATSAPTERPEGGIQTAVFDGAAGESSYRYVDVDEYLDPDNADVVDLRSGGFVAGNFRASKADFADSYDDPNDHTGVKVYWFPLHAAHMPGLTVHATRISGKTITRTMRQDDVAWGRDGNLFYPSGVPIPEPGTWKLTARAGPDRGCFVVTFVP